MIKGFSKGGYVRFNPTFAGHWKVSPTTWYLVLAVSNSGASLYLDMKGTEHGVVVPADILTITEPAKDAPRHYMQRSLHFTPHATSGGS